ncbi:MAG: hydroxyacid dehydrogenase [Verrucomicrobia bacterium]|nr:hydroxyacid dehydrogenase [Verrucomicrobiota bacterium]
MSRPASLLAVLTPTEVREFFPEPMLGQVARLAASHRLLDPTGIDTAALARELAATDPEVLLACWKTPLLPDALPPRLRYVCYVAGSVKRLVTRAHLERGLLVTNWGASISRTVAECALFHILACLRNTSHWAIAMHQPGHAAWKNGLTDARSLFGRTVGIHGFGPVARELVTLLKPWGCPITALAPDLTADLARAHGVERAASLEALFAENEIIVELAPLIPATTGVVTEKILRLIRPGGVFVNVGRGAVVDEAALLRLAQEKKIAIGLDVYTDEPLPAGSGFRALPHVNLTPHIAGPTIDRYPDAGAFALKNLRAYAEGRPLEAVITPEVYDFST